MKQIIEIEVPDGKKAVWKDNKVIFEDIKPQLPRTWEEFCEQNKVKKGECYLDASSCMLETGKCERDSYTDKNILPNKQAAEAHLALMQLHQLRDCYRNGWKPKDSSSVYSIERYYDQNINTIILRVTKYYNVSTFLSFQTEVRAKEFLNNFHELIKQAGDLI